jgi:hypothetical protein
MADIYDLSDTQKLRNVECVHWQHSELIMDAANEIEALRAALSRLLLEFDFLIEAGTLPDIRDDMIFVAARAALGETK